MDIQLAYILPIYPLGIEDLGDESDDAVANYEPRTLVSTFWTLFLKQPRCLDVNEGRF